LFCSISIIEAYNVSSDLFTSPLGIGNLRLCKFSAVLREKDLDRKVKTPSVSSHYNQSLSTKVSNKVYPKEVQLTFGAYVSYAK